MKQKKNIYLCIVKHILLILLLFVGVFTPSSLRQSYTPKITKKWTINVIPLGDVPNQMLNDITQSVESFYGFKCVIRNIVDTNISFLTTDKENYVASKILREYISVNHYLIITNIGIVDKRDETWEMWGLSYCPGPTAVVSFNLLDDDYCSNEVLTNRIIKITLHEIAHTIGFKGHCTTSEKCFMNNGSSGLPELDKEAVWLCNSCKTKLEGL